MLAVPQGKAIVQTVDILTPVVNDPRAFGRIAACNALSDVYAMGGEPWCAMNVACFPEEWAEGEERENLIHIFEGGMDVLDEADCVLAGGHTVQDPELKYGFSVTGLIDPHHIASNDRLQPGHLLLLTKPLGTGILSTAMKAGWEGCALDEKEIIASSGRLNRHAGEAIRTFLLPAATDVTGFGLIGHALEMAIASHVRIRLLSAELPLFTNVLSHAEDGLVPQGAYRNRTHCQDRVRVSEQADPLRVLAAFDPQTSGGLLLAVPPEKRSEVISFLMEHGDGATEVGRVEEEGTDCVRILLD